MATSEVEIVNSALLKIGAEPVVSLTGPTKAQRAAAAQYPLMRDKLLATYNWNFAIKRASLANDTTAPAFGFGLRFPLPTDFLRLIGIYSAGDPIVNYTTSAVDYKIEGAFILADAAPLQIFYVARITDVATFDPHFAEALSWALAADLAYHLTTDQQKAVAALDYLDRRVIPQAKRMNAIAQHPEIVIVSEWIDSRLTDRLVGRRGPVA